MNLITMAMAVWLSVTSPSVVTYQKPPEPIKTYYQPTDRQLIWMSALEWHESRAINEAINLKDSDGTPSYSNFQWKPSTFRYYSLKYEILKKEDVDTDEEIFEKLKDVKLQRFIVSQMLGDKNVKWNKEFPDVVKNKIGFPPKN